MAVETQTELPASFVAGDTIRVAIADSNYPSSTWTLKVLLQSALSKEVFAAAVGVGTAYSWVITAADSAKIPPGLYMVLYRFRETSSGEIVTEDPELAITVYANPETSAGNTIARQTLEAMQAALLALSKGSNITVNFNGQSFTKKNLKDLQDAIDRQQAIVNAEDIQRIGATGVGRILHPL